MNYRNILFFALLFFYHALYSQTNWPGNSWYGATNLTAVMNANGITGASGLHWNNEMKRLYLVQDTGRLRVLQFNESTNSFSQIGNIGIPGDLEGITQVNLHANEFYVVAENEYEIRRYTHNANFTSVTLANTWNLLMSPSPMINTGGDGPEGIAFIPDSFLTSSGFKSSETGQVYTSTKGMGGLIFIAHQDGGYIWVFDINPNQTNDFLYVGKYKTSRTESCGLSFDKTTGLLYILHNIGDNYLEVTDLTSNIQGGDYVFTSIVEYFIPFTMDNKNIEGVAITDKCPDTSNVSAFLCRDASNSQGTIVTTDILRWFTSFGAPGDCLPLHALTFDKGSLQIFPNPASQYIDIISDQLEYKVIGMTDVTGRFFKVNLQHSRIDISRFPSGVYWLYLEVDSESRQIKLIKQ